MNETEIKKAIVDAVGSEIAWETEFGVSYFYKDEFVGNIETGRITLFEMNKGWLVSIFKVLKDKDEKTEDVIEKEIYVPKGCEEDIPEIIKVVV